MLSRTLALSDTIISALTHEIDQNLENYSPTQIIILTLAVAYLIKKAYTSEFSWSTRDIFNNFKNGAVKTLWQTPVVGGIADSYIRQVASKELRSLKNKRDNIDPDEMPLLYALPEHGLPSHEVKKYFENLNSDIKSGRLSGALYTKPTEDYLKLLAEITPELVYINPMHATAWPKIKKMEAAVVSICKKLFNAPPDTHAQLTYGGTYSILEACKAYVMHAREWKVKKGEQPEIIVPTTAHVAFDKAANMFGAKLIKVPVDANGKADIAATKAAITKNTCMLVGSFSFMYGVFDPIVELGDLAKKHNVFFHVDACLGGFEIPFAKDAGQTIPPCDLSIPTIDSYSADIHKFGEGIKGTSILFMRQKNTFSPTTTHTHLGWPGGAYVTQGMGGSGTGLFIGAAYATLLTLGQDGYVENQKKVYALRDQLVAQINQIPGLEIPYPPELSVIGVRTKPGINAHVVIERMQAKGWQLNTINTLDCKPEGFHFCLTAYHTTVENLVMDFTNDLRGVIQYIQENPNVKPQGEAKVYGTLSTGWVPEIIESVIGNLYQRLLNTIPQEAIPGFFEEKPADPSRSGVIATLRYYADRLFRKPPTKETPDPSIEVVAQMKKAL